MFAWNRRQMRRAFTLIELIVATAIIAILVALILPAVQNARESARRLQCKNNLRQIGLALHSYHDSHGVFPISWGDSRWSIDAHSATWLTQILPHLEQQALHSKINFLDPQVSKNKSEVATDISVFLCPSDSTAGVRSDRMLAQVTPANLPAGITNYRGVAGSNWNTGPFARSDSDGRNAGRKDAFRFGNGIFTGGYLEKDYWGPPVPTRFSQITDGMSNTAAVGESVADWCGYSWWYWFNWPNGTMAIPLNYCASQPNCYDDWPINLGFHSRHAGSANFLWADGSVKSVNGSIDRKTYLALGTIMGHEVNAGSAGDF